eukprot:scaffold17342_cov130-Isochrysis_galbana.AAC.14
MGVLFAGGEARGPGSPLAGARRRWVPSQMRVVLGALQPAMVVGWGLVGYVWRCLFTPRGVVARSGAPCRRWSGASEGARAWARERACGARRRGGFGLGPGAWAAAGVLFGRGGGRGGSDRERDG